MRDIELQFIEPIDGAPLYDGERALRYRILRAPLGRPPGSEWFPFEPTSTHLVAVDAGQVVGCALFCADGQGAGRLFQMAVDPTLRGRGLGRRLVRALEARLAAEGIGRIELHARVEARGFYARLGYAQKGDTYLEVGIPHVHMERTL